MRVAKHMVAIVAASTTWLSAISALGQPAAQELRATPCSGCTLTRRVVATLGRPNDSVVVTMWSHVARLGATRYLAGPVSLPGRLAIYRTDGTLERVIRLPLAFYPDGRPFESPHQVGTMFESMSSGVLVLDTGNGRLTHVDTLGRLSTYATMRGSVFGGLSLPDGRVLISAESPQTDPVGRPLHLIDRKRVIRSIGPASGRLGPLTTMDVRVLGAARRGGFWTAPYDRYEISLMDSLGRITTTLTRPFSSPPPSPDGTLAFGVSSIHEDVDGYLWVVSLRRARASSMQPHQEITPGTMRGLAAGLTTTIDVIDPRRGTVVHSQSFPGPATRFIGDRLIARHREEGNGRQIIEVVSVSLSRPGAP